MNRSKFFSILKSVYCFVKNKLTRAEKKIERKFGWLKDDLDERDLLFSAAPPQPKEYAPVDLRPLCPPVADQKDLGACSAFGATELVQYVRKKQKFKEPLIPSPLFTYYVTRELTNTTKYDCGASVRNALKSVVKYGVVPEYTWPYKVEKFAEQPPRELYSRALKYQALSYRRLKDNSIGEMLECLEQGYPFIFGLQIYDSFVYCKKDGIIKLPDREKEFLHGGHCMMCVGWKWIGPNNKYFIVQNSWSDKWGDKGYCYIPFSYMIAQMYASDFWMIRIMEN